MTENQELIFCFLCWLELDHASSFWVTFWGAIDIGFIIQFLLF